MFLLRLRRCQLSHSLLPESSTVLRFDLRRSFQVFSAAGVAVVEKNGPGASKFRPGTRVVGGGWGVGTWQQFLVVKETQLVSRALHISRSSICGAPTRSISSHCASSSLYRILKLLWQQISY